MAEEKTKTEEPKAPVTETPVTPPVKTGPEDDKVIQIKQADYTRKTQRLSELEKSNQSLMDEAAEFGFTNQKDYIEYLKIEVAKVNQPPVSDNQPPPAADPQTPAAGDDNNALLKRVAQLEAENKQMFEQTSTLMMDSQYRGYNTEQKVLEKDKQHGFTRKQLDDFMMDRVSGERVARNVGIFKNQGLSINAYSIAARLMHKDLSEAELIGQGAASANALNTEKAANATMTGTAPPPAEPDKTVGQKEADKIAPNRMKRFGK